MLKHLCIIIVGSLLLFSCAEEPMPRPNGFLRLTVPERSYVRFDTSYPYTFEYPKTSMITCDTNNLSEPYWINIEYPAYKACIYVSYKQIKGNLDQYLEDQRIFINKHIPKANAIDNKIYMNDKDKVYGMTYEIQGSNAASPYQFYVTDSTTHFLRASLYFNLAPNNDSLAPIIASIKQDMEHLINSLQWK